MRRFALLAFVLLIFIADHISAAPCGGATGILQATPPKLIYGSIPVHASKSLLMTISNLDPSNPLNVTVINSQNSRFVVMHPSIPFCVAANSHIDLEVVFTPKQPGLVVSKIK